MFLRICIIVYFVDAVLNFAKLDWGIRKEYRESPERKAWQKKKAVLELVCVTAGILFLSIKENWAILLFGVIGIAAVILGWRNDSRFYKK